MAKRSAKASVPTMRLSTFIRTQPMISSTGPAMEKRNAQVARVDEGPGSRSASGVIGSPAGVSGTTWMILFCMAVTIDEMPPGAKKVNRMRMRPKIAADSGPSPSSV